jgi:hypothetical protein
VPLRRFEGPSLAELTEQARREVGPGARIVRAQRVRRGGVAGFFAREVFVVEVDVPETAELVAADALVDSVADVVEVDFERSLELALASGESAMLGQVDGTPPPPSPRRARLVSLAGRPKDLVRATDDPPDVGEALSAWHERKLDSAQLLDALAAALPCAPTLAPGRPSLLVVAGRPEAARADARRLAEPLSAPVLLASARRTSPWGTAKRSASPGGVTRALERLREHPTVVMALDWEPGPEQDPAELLGAARAAAGEGRSLVVASLPAGLGTRDARWWSSRVGAEALSVHDASSTLEPARALSLGLPVLLLDGAVPTPERWVATLVDARRREDAKWDEPTR